MPVHHAKGRDLRRDGPCFRVFLTLADQLPLFGRFLVGERQKRTGGQQG